MAIPRQADPVRRDRLEQRVAEVDLLVLGDVAAAGILLPEVDDQGEVVDSQQLYVALHRSGVAAIAATPWTAQRHPHLARHLRPAELRAKRPHYPLEQRLGGGDRGATPLHLLDERVPEDPLHLLARLGGAAGRLGDRRRQAAELQIALKSPLEGGQMDACLAQRLTTLGGDDIRHGHPGARRDRSLDRAGEGGEVLRQDEEVAPGAAASRQALGRPLSQVRRRGAGADDDVAVDAAFVPQRLHGGLPAPRRGHLVEQDQPRTGPRLGLPSGQLESAVDRFDQGRGRLVLEQVEGEVDDAPPLGAGVERASNQQLQIRRLAGLARSSQDVDGGRGEIDLVDLRRGEPHRAGREAAQVGVVSLPAGFAPPRVEARDLGVAEH